MNEIISEMVCCCELRPPGTQFPCVRILLMHLPSVIADRVQIQQVLMNLMLNGIEAMSETGGVLMVKSKLREDGQIQTSVNDTGPGLPHG